MSVYFERPRLLLCRHFQHQPLSVPATFAVCCLKKHLKLKAF